MVFHWPIIGHKNIIAYLQSSLLNDRLAQAYLFVGPAGVGKKKTAQLFVHSLLCTHSDRRPCGECSNCRQLEAGIHADVDWLQKEEGEKNISVEQIRILREKLSLRSFLDSYKIAVIIEAQTLSKGAADALLKTLEEPSAKTILLLLTTDKEALPTTIVSRCQVINFLPVNEKEIFQHLQEQGLSRAQADELAHLANGLPGQVMTCQQEDDRWQNYQQIVKEFLSLLSAGIENRLATVEDWFKEKMENQERVQQLQRHLQIWQSVIRDLLLSKEGCDNNFLNWFCREEINRLARGRKTGELLRWAEQLQQGQNLLRQNVNARLVVENIFVNY